MNKKYQERKNTYRNAGILIGILLVIAILLAAFRGCEKEENAENSVETAPGIVYDEGAVEGGWNEVDTDKIIASLK